MPDRWKRWYPNLVGLVLLGGLVVLQAISISSLFVTQQQLETLRQNAQLMQSLRDTAVENVRLTRLLDADASLKRDQLALVSMRLSLIEKALAMRGKP